MAIARFTVVEIVDTLNGKPTVKAWAPAASEQPGLSTAHKILGVTMTASNYQEQVAVMKRGYLRAVTEQNGESWAVGDILWAKNNGSITKTRPAAPLPFILVGTVFADEGSGGPFTVDIDVRVLPSLGELSGVKVEAPVNKDVFIYNDATDVWEPRQLVMADISDSVAPDFGTMMMVADLW